MNNEDFLKFDSDKLSLDDFNFNISSAIPEHELLEFASFDSPSNTTTAGDNANINQPLNEFDNSHQNIDPSSLANRSYLNNSNNPDNLGTTDTTYLDPNSLIQQVSDSFNSSYLSPVGSPYTTHPIPSSNASFQPQSIQQSLSKSLQRQRQGSISNSISTSYQTRKNSIYDNLDSISSPQHSNNIDISSNPTYFSPVPNHSFIKNNSLRQGSINLSTINSPSSYNDSIALSPYNSSFDPSSFKSPRSMAASPGPSGSFGSQSLPKSQLSKEDKLRRRREFHNQVERRRRDLIKEKIKELGLIVPPSLLYVDAEGRETKASKSIIINRTVDYVVHLHKVMKEQERRKAILVEKIADLERNFGALSTNTNTVDSSSTGNNNSNNDNNTISLTPQSVGNSSYNNSPIPEFKVENDLISGLPTEETENTNNNTSEFDVNEFLKAHNETWNHPSV